jgi:predicted nucleic acid-binding protein
MTVKTKVTLNLSKEILEEVRRELAGETLSKAFEKSLESMSAVLFLKKISAALNLEREVLSPRDVPKIRKKSKMKAEEVVREVREGRMGN